MMLLALLWAAQVDVSDLASRAIREDDKEKRQAILAPLRRLDLAEVERALRSPARGPSPIDPGRVVERQARSDLDGEAFTYAVHVPPGYDPARPWPVLVTLHGANPGGDPGAGTRWIQSWLGCPAAREKYVLVSPTTTRHTWAARAGHAYVLTALREVSDLLRIDPDRVFLDGMSMGAGGAFRLAEHHPDRWAAIGPRCNVPDIRQKKDRTFITMLAENFHGVPVYWVAGARDEKIPIDMVRAAKSDLEAARGELVYREFPEGGHDWSLEKDATVLEWYDRHRRVPYPEEVVFKSFEKGFARAWWVEVKERTEPPPLIMIHLDMKGQESERRTELRPAAVVRARRSGNAIEVSTEEVRQLRIWLDDALVDLGRPVTITVNGKKLFNGPVQRSLDTLIDEARRRGDGSMLFTAFVDLRIR